MILQLSGESREERFEKIYRRHYARVWRFYRSCSVADDEAHDLAQDAFHRLYLYLDGYRGADEAVWPFLEKIARNVLYNWVRGRKTQKRNAGAKVVEIDDPNSAFDPPAAAEPDYAERQEEQWRRARLWEAIGALPDGQRESMQLWLEGFKYDEIAVALRVSMDAVKSRLRDAKKTLRAKVGDGGGELPEDES